MSVRALALDRILRRIIRPGSTADPAAAVHAELDRRRATGTPHPAPVPDAVTRRFTTFTEHVTGRPVVTIRPRARAATRAAWVFLPGGGYAHPITGSHWRAIARIAHAARVDAVVPLYQVAPAGTAPDAHRLVAKVLQSTIARYGDGNVALGGDSAGAGLALAALQQRPAGIGAAILYNPWVDVTLADPTVAAFERWDVILRPPELRAWGEVWAGELDPTDPLVSPRYGSFAGLPPVYIVTGGRDAFLPDALTTHRLLHAAGNTGTLLYSPDGNHAVGLMGTATPEARAVHTATVRWLHHTPQETRTTL